MASVKVAVRVRPFNQREKDMNAKLIVQMEGKKTRLLTVKNSKEQNDANREKFKDFTFDHSYWSYDAADRQYASQEQVFSELGVDVIESAFEGYNACVFAYGQTGSGKTFTMMGSPENQGLIPRICRQLFSRVAAGKESGASYRTEVSYLEIYNERVKDLLSTDAGHSLRVREHPRLGPYVQDLSRHLVSDYIDIQECMHRGNLQRTTASTQMNDVSSRSHAIFTITFVQASYLAHNNMPSETVSKVHLVDLAGSERADATGATGQRLVEGAHINKSLVTLGSVISALAENSHQAAEVRTPKGSRKGVFIPYRDSVLTWLLKDSLGGNSKTIMIAAISPADCNYGETLSTLRYANRAKNIINKPTINEDPNVKLIRELREEIEKLRAQISHNTDPIDTESGVLATLQRKEAQEKVLTEKWTEKWRETQQILQEQKALGLRKSGLGVVLDSDMPHLVGIDDNLLSTGVTLYHLKEGDTIIGSEELAPTPDIVVRGAGVLPLHCRVRLEGGVATLRPAPGAQCWLNTVLLEQPAKLSQGCIILLGRTNMFRYNDPAEAAKLRQEGAPGGGSGMNLSRLSLLSWSATDLDREPDDIESDVSAQRAELERERQEFLQQQEERQQELLLQQRRLEEEREAMEREYSAQMERGWARRRRSRHKELAARAQRPRPRRDNKEEEEIRELRIQVEACRDKFEEFIKEALAALPRSALDESSSSESGDSGGAAGRLERLLHHCADDTRDRFMKHKKELADLEDELRQRSERSKPTRLQLEIASLGHRAHCNGDSEEISPLEALKRSKSELTLRETREEPLEPLSDEPEDYRDKKMSLTLPLDSAPSPDETFHTATSDNKTLPGDSSFTSLASPNSPTSLTSPNSLASRSFKLGPVRDADDSDGSSDDYHKPRIVDGQSSSSVDRSPDDRQRAKYRRRPTNESRGARRRVTEAEALRAMARLCARIAAQKMLVISSLENDCSKEDLNRQIAVLQDLQRKYVRLEMALQYSFFDKQSPRRSVAVTPIQETPSLTLSDSDMQVASEPSDLNCNQAFDDPLMSRLKESEIEASDNVSTSNDELQSEGGELDERRRRGVTPPSMTITHGLTHPIDFDRVVSVPGWVTRGAGARTHHEYEVRLEVGAERWVLLRRYRRFRELHLAMQREYGEQVSRIPFPPRVPWPWAAGAAARRAALEQFLRRLLRALADHARSPYHARPLTRTALQELAPFFRKGVFESGKCGTG